MNDSVVEINYSVTGDSDLVDDNYKIPQKLNLVFYELHDKIQKNPKKAIKEILDLIKKYPNSPQLKNHLTVAYMSAGDEKKAYELNYKIYKEFPDYLYSRINLANEYIDNKEYSKIPEILGEFLDLKNLYPERNTFHFSEVSSFHRTVCNYYIHLGNSEQAKIHLDIVKDIDSKFDNLYATEIEKMELRIIGLELLNNMGDDKASEYLDDDDDYNDDEGMVVIPKIIGAPQTIRPKFKNKIINELYRHSLRIDHKIIKEILELPRETLIQDLHLVIYDSILRYDYFSDKEWDDNKHDFPIHALSLLGELKSYESIEVILDFLRQDHDFYDFWIGDYIGEELWKDLYKISYQQLEKLKLFILEPNRYIYTRLIASEVASKVALLFPERREEVIEWYKDVLSKMLEYKNNPNIIDYELNSFIISDIMDFKGIELLPQIKILFDEDLVEEFVCGAYEVVAKEFNTTTYKVNAKDPLNETIYDKYNYILKNWYYYKEGKDLKGRDEMIPMINNKSLWGDEEESDMFSSEIIDNIIKFKSDIFTKSNIGRNDPCPCGSGKKYKKCCMNSGIH